MYLTIAYLSSVSEELNYDRIEELMVDTKTFNNSNAISGVLIYSDFTFFKVIEGVYQVISNLFDKIKHDYRHYNIFILLEVKSDIRKFDRYVTRFITQHENKVTNELAKLIENKDNRIKDAKLHNLIVQQSKSLMNLSYS